jgi:hypothetical protein
MLVLYQLLLAIEHQIAKTRSVKRKMDTIIPRTTPTTTLNQGSTRPESGTASKEEKETTFGQSVGTNQTNPMPTKMATGMKTN